MALIQIHQVNTVLLLELFFTFADLEANLLTFGCRDFQLSKDSCV